MTAEERIEVLEIQLAALREDYLSLIEQLNWHIKDFNDHTHPTGGHFDRGHTDSPDTKCDKFNE